MIFVNAEHAAKSYKYRGGSPYQCVISLSFQTLMAEWLTACVIVEFLDGRSSNISTGNSFSLGWTRLDWIRLNIGLDWVWIWLLPHFSGATLETLDWIGLCQINKWIQFNWVWFGGIVQWWWDTSRSLGQWQLDWIIQRHWKSKGRSIRELLQMQEVLILSVSECDNLQERAASSKHTIILIHSCGDAIETHRTAWHYLLYISPNCA